MGTTEKKDRDYIFYAAGVNLRVVRLNAVVEEYADGRQNVKQREEVYDFAPNNGFLTLRPGEYVHPTAPDGSDEDAIDYLRRSPAFNVTFWEEGNEPHRMLPTERDFLEELIGATTRSDIEAILVLRGQEAGTHKRSMLLDATATALEQLGQEVPSLEALEADAQAETAAAAGLSTG